MYTLIKDGSIFDEYKLVFRDNTIYYQDEDELTYLYVQTPTSRILEIDDDYIWIEIKDPWFNGLVRNIEQSYIKDCSINTKNYLSKVSKFKQSLMYHPDSLDYSVIRVNLRSYTKLWDSNNEDIVKGQKIIILISIIYNKDRLILNATQLKPITSNIPNELIVNSDEFLQECQLQQQLIKI